MEVIAKGSIENLVVEVDDQLDELTELPAGTVYDIFDSEGTVIVANQVATIAGLRARCLINTTLVTMPIGDYELFLKFSSAPEAPVLGPHKFRVR